MPFPTLVPTTRSYEAGDFPVRTYKSQSGAETRILYGSRRNGMALSLSFDNITDAQAEQFLDHFDETKGTFTTFTLPDQSFTGWSGNRDAIDAPTGLRWRYSQAPAVTNVKPGRSSVTVELLGVI
jgi:hypothetical protein